MPIVVMGSSGLVSEQAAFSPNCYQEITNANQITCVEV
jgi:hypothetical protein